MPSQEDLALFAKQNMEYGIFPIFFTIFLYFPGFLLANIVPFLYFEDFYVRQISYVVLSLMLTFLCSMYDVMKNKHILENPLHRITVQDTSSNGDDSEDSEISGGNNNNTGSDQNKDTANNNNSKGSDSSDESSEDDMQIDSPMTVE